LSAIGRFYCEGAVPAVEGIWRAPPNELARRALTDIVEVEIAKIREAVPADHPFVEDAISAFKTDLSPAPRNPDKPAEPAGDAISHVDLALAYQQMGMGDESLAEAAIALRHSADIGDRATEAAAIVLSPGFLRLGMPETLANLRAVLFPG